MKVSVLIITYNHEPFIAQALDSALMQYVDFAYEIVVGEDCSRDRTREIVRDYQKRYPDRIRLLLPERNIGARANFIQALHACRGEYVAWLDGDDYWTSPHKLQKQADVLDRHPLYAMCFHNVVRWHEDGSKPLENNCPDDFKPVLTLADFLSQRSYCLPVSVMFRRRWLSKLPPEFDRLQIGDWPCFALLASQGNMAYINEVMGVYRIHPGGMFSRGGWTPEKRIQVGKAQLECLETVDAYFGYQYHHLIKRRVADVCYTMAKCCRRQNQWTEMRHYLLKGFLPRALGGRASTWQLLAALCTTFFPILHGTRLRLRHWCKTCFTMRSHI
jgi:glycosyltransferase involved in cell wall biosynthesis